MKSKIFKRFAASMMAVAMLGTTVYAGQNSLITADASNAETKEDNTASVTVKTDKTSVTEEKSVNVNVKAENDGKDDKKLRLYFNHTSLDEMPENKEEWSLYMNVPCTDVKVEGLNKSNSMTVSSKSNGLFGKTSDQVMSLKTEKTEKRYSKKYLEVILPANSSMDFDFSISSDVADQMDIVSAITEGEEETYCDDTHLVWTEDAETLNDADKTYRVYTEVTKGWDITVNGKYDTRAHAGDRVDIDCVTEGEGVFQQFYGLTQSDENVEIQYDEEKDSFYFVMPKAGTVIRTSSVSEETAVATTWSYIGAKHKLYWYDHRMNSGKLQVGYFEIDQYGKLAMCVQHKLAPPHPGDGNTAGDMTKYNYLFTTIESFSGSSNINFRKCFYYGYDGPQRKCSADNAGFRQTCLAASYIYSGMDNVQKIGQNFWEDTVSGQAAPPSNYAVNTIRSDTQSSNQILAYAFYLGGSSNEPSGVKLQYKAREAALPTLDIHVKKTDVDTGDALEGASFDVYMDGNKKGTITTDANGKATYQWTGNVITTDFVTVSKSVNTNGNNWGSQYASAQSGVVSSVNQKLATLKSNTKHTWKIVETVAPEGYKLNEKVWEQTLTANTTAVEVSFADEPNAGGFVTLKKSSGNTSITKDNDCYSLKGAEYGIYASETDAKNDTNRKAILTTDENGDTNTEMVGAGTWYIKEIKAGKGYLLCDGSIDNATGGIHKIDVTTDNNEDNPYVVKCTDPVGNDPFTLQLNKMDYDTGKAVAAGDTSLEGAIFELDYYTNTDGKTTGTPAKKWYFKTNKYGILNCNKEADLVNSYTMNNGTVLKSDALYKDMDTNQVQYPIGTYRIKEVVPPEKYQNVGSMSYTQNPSGRTDVTTGLVAVIKQDSNGQSPKVYDGDKVLTSAITASNLSMNIYDKVYKGSISVAKKDAKDNTTPVAGAKYKLVGNTDGKTYSGTTDANGNVSWSELIPQTYTLTELSTPAGYSLLKDNISVKIPMELTTDEIKKYGADINKAVYDEVSQKYCFYDLSYVVGESVTPPFPNTGADQHMLFLLLIGALAITGTGVILFIKKSKKHDADDLPKGIFSK